MPGFDGTGPVGAGKLMGRGMGPCGKVETIETVSRLRCGRSNHRGSGTRYGMGFRLGRGMGFGRGFGLGYGHGMRAFNAQGIQTDAG